MIRQVNVDKAIDYLNELIELDPYWVNRLFAHRENCNTEVATHATVQVQQRDTAFYAGVLGLLNGMFGVYEDGDNAGFGPITAVLDSAGIIVKFERTPVTRVLQLRSYSSCPPAHNGCTCRCHVTPNVLHCMPCC